MRVIQSLNENWRFTEDNNNKYINTIMESFKTVNLPHSWNAEEAVEGNQEYKRQVNWYQYELKKENKWNNKNIFIEFQGVNSVAEVFINGNKLGKNELGFSTFRYDITEHLKEGNNLISVRVDNREYNHIYPKSADFTFFGGIYRDVNLIIVEKTHFDLMDDGSSGVYITPRYSYGNGDINAEALVVNPADAIIHFEILDKEEVIVSKKQSVNIGNIYMEIQDVKTWDTESPHLYNMRISLLSDGELLDQLIIPFGVRDIVMKGEKGFFLNGKHRFLKGVSRHQDRYMKAWAIAKEDMEEDMNIIKEMGANSIRLAHYQHDLYFYNLCNENGMVVWAEVPFISVMESGEKSHKNIMDQLKRLVKQNYNHPSICFWGIANEVTMQGESDELYNNIKELEALVKSLDPTRITTVANVMMTNIASRFNYITDALGYNQYFGWYIGKVEDFKPWLESFHKTNPNMSLGCSEYGAEGLITYHTDNPVRGDYSEEYHAIYHEKVWKIFEETPYLWGSHVWNMFDFSSKLRDEGGAKGMNNKGLVTYDRKIKKDAFYMYKAYWSNEKFTHINSRRFRKRNTETINVKIYSNCKEVELLVNGESIGKQENKKVYIFENIELKIGDNTVKSIGDREYIDEVIFERTLDEKNIYTFEGAEELGYVLSWFEDEANSPEGYYSAKDNIGDLMANPETKIIVQKLFSALADHSMLDEMTDSSPAKMMEMISGVSLETIFSFIKDQIPFEAIQELNKELNKIKKQ